MCHGPFQVNLAESAGQLGRCLLIVKPFAAISMQIMLNPNDTMLYMMLPRPAMIPCYMVKAHKWLPLAGIVLDIRKLRAVCTWLQLA